MKKVSEIFRKYRLCFALNAILVIGIFLVTIYADEYHFGSDMLPFNLMDTYLIFGIPLCGFLYGFITYAKLKKVWIPLLLLVAINFLYWLVFDLYMSGGLAAIILSASHGIFSLLGAGISAFVCYLAKSIKEVKSEYPE